MIGPDKGGRLTHADSSDQSPETKLGANSLSLYEIKTYIFSLKETSASVACVTFPDVGFFEVFLGYFKPLLDSRQQRDDRKRQPAEMENDIQQTAGQM